MVEAAPPLPPGAKFINEPPPLPPGATLLPEPATTAAPVTGGVPRAIGASEYPQEPLQPTRRERIAEVGKAGGLGAALGFATPEIMRGLGAGMRAVPGIAPYAGAVQAMGEASRGAGPRIGQAIFGGIGGLAGETAGQILESRGQGGATAEAARFGAGAGGQLLSEGVARFLSNRVTGPFMSAVLNRIQPGAGTFGRTLGQMSEQEAATAGAMTLNERQREFIRQKLLSIRGRERDPQVIERTEREIYGFLRQVADDALATADTQSRVAFRQADQLLRDAESASGQARADLMQQLGRIQSQFEASATKLEQSGRDAAKLINEQADQAAKQILDRAKQQGPQMQAAAKAEADAIRQRAADDVKQLTDSLTPRMARMREVRDRLRQTAGQRVATAEREVRGVGEQLTPTDLGTRIREGFMNKINELKAIREANVSKNKEAAFGEAKAKEAAGQRFNQTKAYNQAIEQINVALKSPESGLANVPSGEIRKELTGIKEALSRGIRTETTDEAGNVVIKYQPLSFEALEILRRNLRDRSFGLPDTGYSAIGQQQAGKLATAIESIQKEFSPGFEKFLAQYADDSKPLNEFRNKLGKSISGVAEYDMAQFLTDPSTLGAAAFRSAGTVQQIIDTVGAKEGESLARSFIADKTRGGTAKDVAAALDASRDWIGKFPALRQELQQLAQKAGVAESTAARREKLAGVLKTRVGKTAEELAKEVAERPAAAAKQAAEVESKAAKEAAKVLPIAEKEAAAIRKEGAAEAAAKEADVRKQLEDSARAVEKRKAEVGKEAEAKIAETTKAAEEAAKPVRAAGEQALAAGKAQEQLLLGKDVKNVARLKQIIEDAGKPTFAAELKAVGEAIRSSPDVGQKFEQAVIDHIADNFQRSPKGGVDAAETLFKNLRDENLISPQREKEVLEKLREVAVTPADLKTRLSMARTAVRGLIMSGVRTGATAATPNLSKPKEE
jgi:hypothetical protein